MNFSLNLYLYNFVFKQQRHNNEKEDNKVVTVDTGYMSALFFRCNRFKIMGWVNDTFETFKITFECQF